MGARCYCPHGQQPAQDHSEQCTDSDECKIDGSCDQLCENIHGSYNCSCVSGYKLVNMTRCMAINFPSTEQPTLIFSTASDIRRSQLSGDPASPTPVLSQNGSLALTVDHRTRSVYYITSEGLLKTVHLDGTSSKTIAGPSFTLKSVTHVALDWISGNWYFLDDSRELIFVCNSNMKHCVIVIDVSLSKPRGITLDPTKGYMFYTKWGMSKPRLERANLDGTDQKTLVDQKIVYPYGLTVDFPLQHVYWVDTYLDYIDRVDYDGNNRKTIKKGYPVQNLFDVTLFENNLFATSWRKYCIIRVNKFDPGDFEILHNYSRPFSIQVFHRQRQPEVTHPCKISNGGCQHICIPAWKNYVAVANCLCEAGYRLVGKSKCIAHDTSEFLLYAKSQSGMIKGIPLSPRSRREEVIPPIMDLIRPSSISYDVKTQTIYFADHVKIGRQRLDGTKSETILEVNHPEGIVVDWLGRNIYWTQEGRISVASLSQPRLVKTLINDPDMQFKSICLHESQALMFWSMWKSRHGQEGRIEYAYMDGQNRKVFLNKDITWPSGLTVDTMRGRLYFCDSFRDTIESVDIFGGPESRKVILSGEALAHPFGLAYFSNTLFWSDFQLGKIQSYDLSNKTTKLLGHENPPLHEVRVYDKSSQMGISGCSNLTCPHLCLLNNYTKGSCYCADGFSGVGNGNCTPIMNHSPPSACRNNQWQCLSGLFKCINKAYLCDGESDCSDGSDEVGNISGPCYRKLCPEDMFQCDNYRCLELRWICDGEADCSDRKDEENCNLGCEPPLFTCAITKRCIPESYVCDSDFDCGHEDTSDEPQNCTRADCSPTEFMCANSRCISMNYVCDGDDDCRDGSDEKNCLQCDKNSKMYCSVTETCIEPSKLCNGAKDCPDGRDELNCTSIDSDPYCLNGFLCINGTCLSKEVKCNNVKECIDGTDELGCNNTWTVDCPDPKRTCDNGSVCLELFKLCDGRNDCQDGYDESLLCGEDQCAMITDCTFCQNTPEGHICYCPDGQYFHEDTKMCKKDRPCSEWGTCSQRCLEVHRKPKCYCIEGYILEPDGFSCKSNDSATPYVIFSNRHELRSVDLHSLSVRPLISSLKNTIALDFLHDPKGADIIFWTDIIDNKIYKGSLISGTIGNIEVVVETGLSTAEGLAVDWIGYNLYWVESSLDQIEVARLDGKYRRTLIAGEMESPRAIALDPRKGLLFWTDWDANAPRIESCSMAGYGRKVVVYIDHIGNGAWPNGLTLDYVLERIYWIDARSDSIHTTTYAGTDHHEVLKGHEMTSHPFAITLFENYVFWTDWRSSSVIRANKWTGSQVTVLQRTLSQPFDIKILHPSRQPRGVANLCGINNGNCSHLCLLDFNSIYKCDCPHVMKLADDKKTCVENNLVMLFSRANEIRGVDLSEPYYHTIPTISIPQVQAPVQLDFLAKNRSIYWADSEANVIRRTNLSGGTPESIIDTGIDHPTGFAIDWISENMFLSSVGTNRNKILACTLNGEFITTVYTTEDHSSASIWEDYQIRSLAVDPLRGKLYWAQKENTNTYLKSSDMSGHNVQAFLSSDHNHDLIDTTSLTVDTDKNRLYWVNVKSKTIQFYDMHLRKLTKLPLREDAAPLCATLFNDLLYYAAQDTLAIYSIDKSSGSNSTLIRNNTGIVMSLKIYNPSSQNGTNACAINRGNCSHLCFPISTSERVCACAAGYTKDSEDSTKCHGINELIIYSINWEMRGLSLAENDTGDQVLGPISRVSMADSIDYDAANDYIYWADGDHGTITRVHRDGTGREVVIGHHEPVDSLPVDWLTGLAVDWVSGNIYWADPKLNVIEVAKLNGSHRYVVVHSGLETVHSLAVDPVAGLLFWSDNAKPPWIAASGLDGSNIHHIFNLTEGSVVNDITLDYDSRKVYWCNSGSGTISRINYDGTTLEMILSDGLRSPFAVTYFNSSIYWIDLVEEKGSIKKYNFNRNMTSILASGLGDSLKDMTVFSMSRQKGTNPCAKHTCPALCLFNGSSPICVCPHGYVSEDRTKCLDYDIFLMYSKVIKIESIHITDANNANAPFPTIQDTNLMRNAIGLAYDYERKTLFYSDIQRGSINAVHFNGTNHRVIIERQGSVEGITYGPVENALYWTCNNAATIYKADLSNISAGPLTIVKLTSSDKPRGIAVDPCDSRLYWTNWNSANPSIQRSFTSGYGLESIITTDIRMPNAITLDHGAQKLYWGDARLDKIERAEYDGTNRIVLSKATPQHPFDMAVYGEFIFWTDWIQHSVMRANKYTGEEVVWLRRDVPRPMGIIAVANTSYDCFYNPCRVLNGECEDICHLDSRGVKQCSCHPGRILVDGKRCINITMDCSPKQFTCSEGSCIPHVLTCDGIRHCPDGSDENISYCVTRNCLEKEMRCYSGHCIDRSKICDGVEDCSSGEDEKDCPCPDSRFKCKSGECIRMMFRCDRDQDCKDASDEMGCPIKECSQFYGAGGPFIPCNTTSACILPSWICDGQNDCLDNSDEHNCTHHQTTVGPVCSSDRFMCASGQCIKQSWVCDGEDDCQDGTDEKNCTRVCGPEQFKCNSSVECIPLTNRCNGVLDCTDRSDELDCGSVCTGFPCGSLCISKRLLCDGENDCPDGADESIVTCLDKTGFSCSSTQIKCANHKCIEKEYYCDGDDDCGDNSDEPKTCSSNAEPCSENKIHCADGQCISKVELCSGKNKCINESHEAIFDKECKDYSCEENGLFRCQNHICISMDLTCDGINDCSDFSDEELCNINECDSATNPCQHICTDLPVGFKCSCLPGFYLHDGTRCGDIDECNDVNTSRPCSQKCINRIGSYECSCYNGYEIKPDKRTCKLNSTDKVQLIFANKYYIRRVDSTGHSTTPILVSNLTNAVALDYDWLDGCFYWSDVTALRASINRLCPSDTQIQTLHSSNLDNPDGLAVDWVGRNLYWCDKESDTIEVSKLDGSYRKILIKTGLSEPRAIALLPQEGYLFWSDWSENPHIGKAGMDGSQQRYIIQEGLGWPNALTIDYDDQLIFWADAREDYIACADLEGKNRRIILSRSKIPSLSLHHVFAIAVFEDSIYWTDWETKSIEKCDKYGFPGNGTGCKRLVNMIHRPMDLRIYHPLRQVKLKKNPCAHGGGCDTLCLLKPGGGRTCDCPENYYIGGDQHKCVSNCTNAQFECKSTYRCIPFWWKCDTQNDCGDFSDEPDDCPTFKCVPGQHMCNSGKCIHPGQVCNGEDDCGDNSDEKNCEKYPCLNSQFKCVGNNTVKDKCILRQKQCDGRLDCPLGQDEDNCQEVTCSPDHFQCGGRKCIPQVWICDGSEDCPDGSDEKQIMCANRTCPTDLLACSSGRCIPQSWVCDGVADCPDGFDEPKSCADTAYTCEPTYFKCQNNKCIPGRWKCDYEDDCHDNSDEINCNPRNCSESEFMCKDKKCISGLHQCDGEHHCDDGSDEQNCPTKCSPGSEFECRKPKTCIFMKWRCDGDVDCLDGSDEEGCNKTCSNGDIFCSGHCLPSAWRCDAHEDCPDGQDEEDCASFVCPPSRFRCLNDKCIPKVNVCDGVNTCGDNSDESSEACAGLLSCDGHRCSSGHCISHSLLCDSWYDCPDGSDEENCPNKPCYNCPQICAVRGAHKVECECAEGYTKINNSTNSCRANGAAARLLYAGDSGIRFYDPYKSNWLSDINPNSTEDKPTSVTHDVAASVVYISYGRAIVRCAMNNKPAVGRCQKILENDEDSHGLAWDWAGKNLYMTLGYGEDGSIAVINNQISDLVKIVTKVKDPRDICLHPNRGLMFWNSVGGIYKAGMDGTDRSLLVNDTSSSIALDLVKSRLYWADPRSNAIVSILIEGTERIVHYKGEHNWKPHKLDIFEEYLYISMYIKNKIVRIDRWNNETVIVDKTVDRPIALHIVQEQKQPHISVHCHCQRRALCLLGPKNITCLCPHGDKVN
ncbi:unnamed protein product [Nezara viridula]|uniref:EGF-like domain-containing protein n=1 Tax=Nezara viridula TaxID=85310 RepID=A0A9P0H0P4_NEZVI|nr:unnamed protein product [Nezara viridula]